MINYDFEKISTIIIDGYNNNLEYNTISDILNTLNYTTKTGLKWTGFNVSFIARKGLKLKNRKSQKITKNKNNDNQLNIITLDVNNTKNNNNIETQLSSSLQNNDIQNELSNLIARLSEISECVKELSEKINNITNKNESVREQIIKKYYNFIKNSDEKITYDIQHKLIDYSIPSHAIIQSCNLEIDRINNIVKIKGKDFYIQKLSCDKFLKPLENCLKDYFKMDMKIEFIKG